MPHVVGVYGFLFVRSGPRRLRVHAIRFTELVGVCVCDKYDIGAVQELKDPCLLAAIQMLTPDSRLSFPGKLCISFVTVSCKTSRLMHATQSHGTKVLL